MIDASVYLRMKETAERLMGRELTDIEIIESMADAYNRNQQEIADLIDEIDELRTALKNKPEMPKNLIPLMDRIDELLKVPGQKLNVQLEFENGELVRIRYEIAGEETNEPFCW